MKINLVKRMEFGIARYFADCPLSAFLVELADQMCLTGPQVKKCQLVGFEINLKQEKGRNGPKKGESHD